MKLSIIIPVFNESATIEEILVRVNNIVLPKVEKEIIIVDDGSTDRSAEIIKKILPSLNRTIFIQRKRNGGKGSAVNTAIKKATGDYMVIQDADLEYHPKQIAKLLIPIREGKAKVVYGSRLMRLPNFKKEERTFKFALHYFGNKTLSFIASILYLQWVTDIETCYKVIPLELAKTFTIKAKGFEFEPEVTAKILKSGYKIKEIPISTTPRNKEEGKKLNTWNDGFKALVVLIKFRFTN